MTSTTFVFIIFLKLIEVENRMLPFNYRGPNYQNDETRKRETREDESSKVIGLANLEDNIDDYDSDLEKLQKKTCAVVVLSSVQNPVMQSLLRRYRYDANGSLIPSSVQYFMKLPQGTPSQTPILVPLNEKAFSPLGGYIRYYKEVPAIPHTW